MKKKLLSLILVLVLLLSVLAPAGAVGDQVRSHAPIYLGEAEVDAVADMVLQQIDTAGKTDLEKIRAVYTWIQENCSRDSWDGTPHFDEAEVQAIADKYAQKMQQDVDAGLASWRTEYQSGGTEVAPGYYMLSYDSNAYIAVFAYEMFYTHTGNCAHFSAMLTVLLNHLGFDCRLIDGEYVNRDGSTYEHKWNCVLVDGQYYWLDARIDHANYTRTGKPSYVLFMEPSTEKWDENHNWDHTYSDWLFAHAGEIAGEAAASMPWSTCSGWAEEYLTLALAKELIPEILQGSDMTAPISRAEFAAVSVLLYEALGGEPAAVPMDSPFTDSQDPMVLQAHALDVVQGVGEGRFAPASTLTREQAATMLGRVYERISTGHVGTGESFEVTGPSFTDQNDIAEYARNYIGFFAYHDILSGTGNGAFAPKAEMTREQALKVAVMCLEKLG